MERSKARAYIFPATILQLPALWPTGAGELSGSDPWAGPFWPELALKTRVFHLRTDWSDRTVGKQPYRLIGPSRRIILYFLFTFFQIEAEKGVSQALMREYCFNVIGDKNDFAIFHKLTPNKNDSCKCNSEESQTLRVQFTQLTGLTKDSGPIYYKFCCCELQDH